MRCPAPVSRAVLIEPALPETLSVLSDDGDWCGLPLVNHPLLERQLEDLAYAGVTDVQLLHRGPESRNAEYAELGARWGLGLSARQLRTGGADAAPDAASPTLFLRMDCWPGADGLRALLFGSCMPGRRLAGRAGPMPCYVTAGGGDPRAALVYCRDALLIRSLEDYWNASIELLGRLSGTSHLERPRGDGCYVGTGARLHESAQIAGPCLVGSGAYVGRRCVIGPRAIVGDGAYLDSGVRVTDSMVLGSCHVESGADLHGVIVTGTSVLCWRSGRVIEFDHTVVLPNWWSKARNRSPARGRVNP